MSDIVSVLREYANPNFTLSVPDFAKRAMLDGANEIAGLRGTLNASSRALAEVQGALQSWVDNADAGGVEPADLEALRHLLGVRS